MGLCCAKGYAGAIMKLTYTVHVGKPETPRLLGARTEGNQKEEIQESQAAQVPAPASPAGVCDTSAAACWLSPDAVLSAAVGRDPLVRL